MDIGNVVRVHRKKAGLSRIELARVAGVGKTTIYDIEHGLLAVRLSSILKIFEVLNIKLHFTGPYMKECENQDAS